MESFEAFGVDCLGQSLLHRLKLLLECRCPCGKRGGVFKLAQGLINNALDLGALRHHAGLGLGCRCFFLPCEKGFDAGQVLRQADFLRDGLSCHARPFEDRGNLGLARRTNTCSALRIGLFRFHSQFGSPALGFCLGQDVARLARDTPADIGSKGRILPRGKWNPPRPGPAL